MVLYQINCHKQILMPPDDIHCSARPLLRMIVGNTCVQCDNIKGRMIRSPTQSHSARKMGVKM